VRRPPEVAEPGDELAGAERWERDGPFGMNEQRPRVESEPVARAVVGHDDLEPLGGAGGENRRVERGDLHAGEQQGVEVHDRREARLRAERIRRAPVLGDLVVADECAYRDAVEQIVVGRTGGVDRPRVARREKEGGAPAPRTREGRIHVGLDVAHDAAEWTAACVDRAGHERA
jgi:hypothetical protein